MKIKQLLLFSFITGLVFVWILYQMDVIDFIISLIILIVILMIHYFIYNKFIILNNEFENLNKIIENLLSGKHDTGIIHSNLEDNKVLNANMNRLAKRMEKMTFKNEEDEKTIQLLTHHINSPIIYIDIDGRIRYLNEPFLKRFNSNVVTNDLYEKIRIRKLYGYIDDAFVRETNLKETLLIQDHYYQANAITIKNTANKFVGILFIFNDVTDIKNYEKLQREFLADASHELKTPLSAIKGASEILIDGVSDDQTRMEFLNMIKSENDRMERIVQDILLISRLESDNLKLKFSLIHMKELVEDVSDILNFRLKNKNQNLMIEIEEDLYINGDYERLKHALINLVSNAITYTDGEKSIFIIGSSFGDKVKLMIKDEGIGISAVELPHIFERFYRVDKARSRETGGTGLGLSIVKSTLDIHNAQIEVESTEGEGTTFTLTFKAFNNKRDTF
jgi:two-component system, OmpR family, phosphate regulon sensor histidine kinase PhoR